jgi:hypothetical protein
MALETNQCRFLDSLYYNSYHGHPVALYYSKDIFNMTMADKNELLKQWNEIQKLRDEMKRHQQLHRQSGKRMRQLAQTIPTMLDQYNTMIK